MGNTKGAYKLLCGSVCVVGCLVACGNRALLQLELADVEASTRPCVHARVVAGHAPAVVAITCVWTWQGKSWERQSCGPTVPFLVMLGLMYEHDTEPPALDSRDPLCRLVLSLLR